VEGRWEGGKAVPDALGDFAQLHKHSCARHNGFGPIPGNRTSKKRHVLSTTYTETAWREIDREKRGAFFVLVVTVRCVKPVMGLERGYGEENHLRWLQGIEE
jgi:hypothetical protein